MYAGVIASAGHDALRRGLAIAAPHGRLNLLRTGHEEGDYFGRLQLAMRCPVYRRRDSNLGFRAELENLVGSVKGKGASGKTVRPKVPMGQPGADCSVVAGKQGNACRVKGARHRHRDRKGQRETGGTRWS